MQSGLAVPPTSDVIDVSMLSNWREILPAAIENLNSLHWNMLTYLLTLQGKRKATYSYAKNTWKLGRDDFDAEMRYAFTAMWQHLNRYGIATSSDLEFL
jgi:hypothetical protein